MKKEYLVKKIRKEFPQLNWQSAVPNTTGWDHNVLILDNKYVFRFPWDEDSKLALQDEIPLLNFLSQKVSLPIPKYKYVHQDKSFAGYDIIIGERFSKTLFAKLNQAQKTKIAKQLARFLTELHTIPLAKLKRFKIPRHNAKRDYAELLQAYETHIRPKLIKQDQIIIKDFLSHLKNYLSFPKQIFTHSDIHHDNTLYNRKTKKITGIIDFSDRHIDDPAIDFNQFWLYGRKFVEEIYKYYKGPKDGKFLERTLLYYKRDAIQVMAEPKSGDGRNPFKLGYEIYNQAFAAELAKFV